MRYVEKIQVIDNLYPSNKLPKDFEINCFAVNLLVGNQGTGKSTLLNLLKLNHNDLKITLSENTIQKGVDTFFFDTEKDNPRIKDPNLYTKANGDNVGIGYTKAVMSRFKSHGEIMEIFIIDTLLKAKDCVIFLDEPESGLSITNQFKLIDAINKAVLNNCQLFIATHCYPLIENFDVISLEHYKQMSGEEFIDLVSKEFY